VLVSVVLALALGVGTALVVRSGRGQTALGWAAPIALALAGVYAVAKEWRGGYRSSEWPQIFDPVHVLGIFAVLALAAVAVVTAWRDERGTADNAEEVSSRRAGAGDPTPPA
jgi:TRAP-type C4-dicarboxylate transport system permease small subunit